MVMCRQVSTSKFLVTPTGIVAKIYKSPADSWDFFQSAAHTWDFRCICSTADAHCQPLGCKWRAHAQQCVLKPRTCAAPTCTPLQIASMDMSRCWAPGQSLAKFSRLVESSSSLCFPIVISLYFSSCSFVWLPKMDLATDILLVIFCGLLIQVGSKEWMGSVNPQFVSLGILVH
jgi:hypothetical protein